MSNLIAFSNQRDFQRMADAVDMINTRMDLMKREMDTGSFRDFDFVKVTTVLNDSDDLKDDPSYKREAEAVSVSFDASSYTWGSTSTYIYKDADLDSSEKKTVFYRSNISSESELELDKVYLVASYTDATETSDWVVIETGGGGQRELAWVIITEVEDAANYTGSAYTGRYESTRELIDNGVVIRVDGATSNAFDVGYENWATITTDEGDDGVITVYLLDGLMLG